MINAKTLRLALAGLFGTMAIAVTAPPVHAAPPPVTVADGFVPEAPPGVRVMAAFMTIRNPGLRAVTLIGAGSPDFKRVEMHATRMVDGMADMVEIARIPIPPKGQVIFAQGGNHFMLFDPRHAVAQGQQVTLILRFSDGRTQSVKLPVRDGRQIYRPHR